MANPVVHFEVIGKDGGALQSYYKELFGWDIDANNPIGYGNVQKEQGGIGGGIGNALPGSDGHVTFYVGVPDVESALAKAESLGGSRVFGPGRVPGTDITLGQFTDPEGHLVGVMNR